MKRQIRLIALDMDGTLLDDRKEISPATCQVLTDLREAGVPVALCTGRCRKETEIYPQLTSAVPYGILASGAWVLDMRSGETISGSCITAETALAALAAAGQEDAVPHLLTGGASVCCAGDIARLREHQMGAYEPMFRAICEKPRDMAEYIRTHEDRLYKLNFYFLNGEARARVEARLADLPLELVHAETASLECTAAGVAKDTGLSALCAFLGIPLSQVLAIGDSDNDLPMLKAAGVSVAMGNAPERIRTQASFVTLDNNRDGAAEALRRFFPDCVPAEDMNR